MGWWVGLILKLLSMQRMYDIFIIPTIFYKEVVMKFLPVLISAIFLSGCATIISGDTETVTFNSSPEGADVYIDGAIIGNDGGDNQKSAEQPKVASQMDNSEVKSKLITADKTAPTTVEMANAELTDNERKLKVKRGKKTKTVLTSITGDNTKATLSKKVLLG